ncbi:MAG: hypothetical protein ACRCXB_31385 [Aeromonadaceae bacterium]
MNDKQQLAAMGEHMREMKEYKPEFRVPDGWKLVPKLPTIDMMEVSYSKGKAGCSRVEIYLAMLAAAPEYKP